LRGESAEPEGRQFARKKDGLEKEKNVYDRKTEAGREYGRMMVTERGHWGTKAGVS